MIYIRRYTRIFKQIAILLCCAVFTACSQENIREIDSAVIAENAQQNIHDDSSFSKDDSSDKSKEVTSLTIGVLKNTSTLHPLYLNNEQMENVLSLIFEPAVKLDSMDNPAPSVIESWEVDENGEDYIFHIRQNVKFHNSDAVVTSEDIIYALDVIMDSDSSDCRYSAYKGCVKKYEAIDDYTISISLKRATADIFYLMNFPVFQKDVYKSLSKSTLKTPIGTGGYKVQGFDTDNGIVLEQNENWWRVHGPISSITVKYYDTHSDILTAYRDNEVDTLLNTDVSLSSITSSAKSAVYYTTTQYYDALVPNCKAYPMNITDIRLGIAYALNRDDIIEQCLLGEGMSTMTPIRMDKWYMSDVKTVSDDNSEKAYAYFKEAGYTKAPNGKLESNGIQLRLKLIYSDASSSGYKSNVAAVIRTQLSEYGIDVDIKKMSFDSFLTALKNKDFDMALCSFYSMANDDLSSFFGSSATLNYGNYTGESVDSLIKGVKDVYGEDEVSLAYNLLQDYLLENMPHISLYYRYHSVVLPKEINNVGLMHYRSIFTDLNTWKKSQ